MKTVELARISSWDGSSIVGVFSTKEKALAASVSYLLKKSDSMYEDEIETPINKEVTETSWVFDITNSYDILVITTMIVDEDNKRS